MVKYSHHKTMFAIRRVLPHCLVLMVTLTTLTYVIITKNSAYRPNQIEGGTQFIKAPNIEGYASANTSARAMFQHPSFGHDRRFVPHGYNDQATLVVPIHNDGFYKILPYSEYKDSKYSYLNKSMGFSHLEMPEQSGNSDPKLLKREFSHRWNDRIFDTLAYEPLKQPTGFKRIFRSRGGTGHPAATGSGQKTFVDMKCKVRNCSVLSEDKDVLDADLVIFSNRHGKNNKIIEILSSNVRKPQQIWAMFTMEHLQAGGVVKTLSGREYNWTITYDPVSTVPITYATMFPIVPGVHVRPQTKNYAEGKKPARVVWVVSHCRTRNKRLEYANELRKHIDVDIFGRCGQPMCRHFNSGFMPECEAELISRYKFYLSFENENCETYVTEKFFMNGLSNDVIPVTMGAHPDYYRRISPPHSHIHVEQFSGPKQLAEYLHKLDTNDDLYNAYFRWKGAWRFLPWGNLWCRLCAALHAGVREDEVWDVPKWEKIQRCIGDNRWTPI